MAARLWFCVLAGEVAVAAGAAWLLAIGSTLSAPALVATGLAILAAPPWVLAATAWLVARVLARSPRRAHGPDLPQRPRSASAVLRSIVTEGAALARAGLAMSMAVLHRPPRVASSPDERGRRPVLMIHGVLCNGAVWRPLARRLAAAGFGPVRILDLEPLAADLEWHAARVAHELVLMHRECGGERIAIVAHSMGGLIARAGLRLLPIPRIVSRIITLATPHHGTAMARLLHTKPMEQMLPGSPWLRALNADPHALRGIASPLEPDADARHGPDAVPITSVSSADDALVVPSSSARLEGACNIELRGVGHLGLLTSRRSREVVLRALEGDSVASVRRCERHERNETPR